MFQGLLENTFFLMYKFSVIYTVEQEYQDNNVLRPLSREKILSPLVRMLLVIETVCKKHVALLMFHPILMFYLE